MKSENEFPETLHNAVKFFSQPDAAFNFLVALRWPKGVECPKCKSKDVRLVSTRKIFECKHCVKKQFSARVGTLFEDSPLGLDKWFIALWLLVNAKNGISSYELHRSLGVTQKTGWFMLQRLRLAVQNGSILKMSGHVEADESFIGGKARNMHAKLRKAKVNGRTGGAAMTPVMGLLERTTAKKASRVILKVVDNRKRAELQGQVRKYVLKGSEVHTDALRSYNGLNDEYTHNVVDHAVCYAKGHVHTNGLENFWSLLKRSIKGTYVNVEPFHLFRYLDEQAFRFNQRKNEDGDQGRFLAAVKGIIGKSLKYVDLIGKNLKEGETQTPESWQTA